MSRSYKHQPFTSICGNCSAKRDKMFAHRGERRKNKQAIHNAILEDDFENFLAPHRLECSHNEVWCWNRDGKQSYTVPSNRDWHNHLKALDPEIHCQYEWMYDFYKDHCSVWPPQWYVKLFRK